MTMNKATSRRQGRVRWWRLRRNPLRRRSYLVEAWLRSVTGILAVTFAIVMGVLAAHAVEGDLDGLRAERHAVPAVLTTDAKDTVGVEGTDADRAWAHVRWTAADGTPRTGVARVDSTSRAGSTTRVWLDAEGRLVPEPATAGEAEFQGAVLGAAAAVGTGAAVLLLGGLACARLDRRRQDQWDTEWALIDPRWGRKTG
ncbi:hypothetical protein RKD19_001045 [Streptomyces canus]|uniref:Rv1733c family protein n=1 Tax=Streptomyces sp. RP5T TaxID=2490848 RepID=UPI000F650813|nr:hypothetical protein [Streptomyces sp. RP5T]RRR85930.1 hypothetical protein EHS43_06210 [Streptomyces sp. RP5T]